MHKIPLVIIPALLLSSCSEWEWGMLNPLYMKPQKQQDSVPTLVTLPDGRDFSGYEIPPENNVTTVTAKTEKKPVSNTQAVNDTPVGTDTGRPNEVRSPHAPYKLLDRSGMKAGDLVRDPATMRVFILP